MSGEQALYSDLLSSIEATTAITPDEGEKEGRRGEERVGDKGEDFPRRQRLGSPEVYADTALVPITVVVVSASETACSSSIVDECRQISGCGESKPP